jgi:hypothetical protein
MTYPFVTNKSSATIIILPRLFRGPDLSSRLSESFYAAALCRASGACRHSRKARSRSSARPAVQRLRASSADRSLVSVAPRGPRPSSVLRNPWPDTHSGNEWRDARQLYNDHLQRPKILQMPRGRPAREQECAGANPSFSTTRPPLGGGAWQTTTTPKWLPKSARSSMHADCIAASALSVCDHGPSRRQRRGFLLSKCDSDSHQMQDS